MNPEFRAKIARKVLAALLAVGTVAGFASGFHDLRRHGCHAGGRAPTFEDRVAATCVRAAENARSDRERAPRERDPRENATPPGDAR